MGETLLKTEPANAAAKAMLQEAHRSSELSDRRAKKMSQRMLSVERDPRVPPTQREVAMDTLRRMLSSLREYVESFPRRCRAFPASVFAEVRRRYDALMRPVLSRLRSVGFSFGKKSSNDPKTD